MKSAELTTNWKQILDCSNGENVSSDCQTSGKRSYFVPRTTYTKLYFVALSGTWGGDEEHSVRLDTEGLVIKSVFQRQPASSSAWRWRLWPSQLLKEKEKISLEMIMCRYGRTLEKPVHPHKLLPQGQSRPRKRLVRGHKFTDITRGSRSMFTSSWIVSCRPKVVWRSLKLATSLVDRPRAMPGLQPLPFTYLTGEISAPVIIGKVHSLPPCFHTSTP